ncbi:hypothetical protein CERZMDRAFT_102181 [Cercospora zeae-maydis SCOH1-5]|uniref:Uncharacterized protein n=1 Tax=Cercospora zeae-maydis SCOH1-5 TaxID=717836 RepID=A0A6A6F2L6_9PEZI|nr:hypothetical protein CERZMDRAFT_102181 [Cercospora zeae-maydis SCOH1-5]
MGNNSESTSKSAPVKTVGNLTGQYEVTVKKYDKDGNMVDTYNLTMGGNEEKKTEAKAVEGPGNVTVEEESSKSYQTKSQEFQQQEKPFYTYKLPLKFVYLLHITPLCYLWQMQLESTFPARLKAKDIIAKNSHHRKSSSAASSTASLLRNQDPSPFDDIGEDGSPREEAIVQKWIEQGKVKRQSLNWLNTLTKWFLEMTLASILQLLLAAAWDDLVLDQQWRKLSIAGGAGWIGWWMALEVLLRYVWSFAGLRPLAILVSFIVIPAHQRIVFVAGVDLVCATFFGLLVQAFLPWVEGTQFVKDLVGNMTDKANGGAKGVPRVGVDGGGEW